MTQRLFSIVGLIFFIILASDIKAQEFSTALMNDIKADDSVGLSKDIISSDISRCDGNYSLLSQCARYRAVKCIILLLDRGADANKVCDGYVPPLMHAVKYGSLEIVKALINKGADIHYVHKSSNVLLNGQTPLTYAEAFKQTIIADYLRQLQ